MRPAGFEARASPAGERSGSTDGAHCCGAQSAMVTGRRCARHDRRTADVCRVPAAGAGGDDRPDRSESAQPGGRQSRGSHGRDRERRGRRVPRDHQVAVRAGRQVHNRRADRVADRGPKPDSGQRGAAGADGGGDGRRAARGGGDDLHDSLLGGRVRRRRRIRIRGAGGTDADGRGGPVPRAVAVAVRHGGEHDEPADRFAARVRSRRSQRVASAGGRARRGHRPQPRRPSACSWTSRSPPRRASCSSACSW